MNSSLSQNLFLCLAEQRFRQFDKWRKEEEKGLTGALQFAFLHPLRNHRQVGFTRGGCQIENDPLLRIAGRVLRLLMQDRQNLSTSRVRTRNRLADIAE